MDIDERARRARAILEDALVKEAIAAIRERQIKAFENSAIGDTEALITARQKLWAIEQFVGEFKQALDDQTIRKVRET